MELLYRSLSRISALFDNETSIAGVIRAAVFALLFAGLLIMLMRYAADHRTALGFHEAGYEPGLPRFPSSASRFPAALA